MMVAAAGKGGGRAGRLHREGDHWFCSSVLQSDIMIEVEGIFFHLHKFPLISKCGKIARVVDGAQSPKEPLHHTLVGCPGGPDGFYIAATFCYGAQVEFSPKNAFMVYCISEFLEMTEEYGSGNLLSLAESYIHKTILRSWKDCILALESFHHCIPDAEDHPVVHKCLNALSMMACTDPSLFGWPMMMYGSLQSPGGSILWNGINTGAKIRSAISDWWFEDVSCLGVPMFKKLIETMNKFGIRPENTTAAIIYYARKHLPGLARRLSGQGGKIRSIASLSMMPAVLDQKALVESIIELLPEKKGKSYCQFLLGILRLSIILDVNQSRKESLERKIGMQLEYATLDGLLVPNFFGSDNLYDTDSVERMIRHFWSFREANIEFFSPMSSETAVLPLSGRFANVTKLVDTYLAEVAPDVNLKPQKMKSLMEALPESCRTLDDGMYRALDIYFKEHPWLPEREREQLCTIINWSRLSFEACTHASQNERLPLRFILQVLFFEQMQLRAALSNYLRVVHNDNMTSAAEEMTGDIRQGDGWVSVVSENQHLRVDMERLLSKVRKLEEEFVNIKQEMGKVSKTNIFTISRRSISRTLGCTSMEEPQTSWS